MYRRTAAALILLAACSSSAPPAAPETKLPTSAQRTGDPDAGYQYLLYGNFVSSGIPLATFTQIFGSSSQDLQRTGDSAGIPYNYNVVTASNGVKVVVPQCFTCHAENLLGTQVLGLGNNSNDYSTSELTTVNLADGYIQQQFGATSPEYAAFQNFGRGTKAISPLILTDVQGVNPADKIFAVLSAHRDPATLEWIDTATSTLTTVVVPTDVPPYF